MIEEKLAGFAHHHGDMTRPLDILRLSLLDWCAVGIAGEDEPVARILREQALAEGGAGQAGLFGAGSRVPARAAALVNGTISHALDYDDTHFAHIGHPSAAVMPAALAVGQMVGAKGAAMQEAALIGAEASIRVGLWLGREHYQAGFHQTATAGAFGACLAACRLLLLTPEQTLHALGLASTRASGLKSQFGTMGKPMNAGIAAANGVEAALLVRRGFVSIPDGLSHAQGFGATHHGAAQEGALDRLGRDWLFERISHKLHACCHGLHAMLEALAQVGDLHAEEVARIEIHTHPRWLSVCNQPAPQSGLEAKFSYRVTAAMCVTGHDTSLPGNFTNALCQDPQIVALRDRVEVTGDETLTEMKARVVVTSTDGTAHEQSHDLDRETPLADRQTRVRAKAAALLGSDRAEVLWDKICAQATPDAIAEALAK